MTLTEMRKTNTEDLRIDMENIQMQARVVKRNGGKGSGPRYTGLMNRALRIDKFIKDER